MAFDGGVFQIRHGRCRLAQMILWSSNGWRRRFRGLADKKGPSNGIGAGANYIVGGVLWRPRG